LPEPPSLSGRRKSDDMPNTTRKTILVTGATGHQGGAVARTLLQRGHNVRALTRKSRSPAANALAQNGAKIVEGTLEDRDSLAQASEGADAIFLVTTPFESGMDAEISQGRNAVDAAKSAGIAHVVFSSVIAADRNTRVPHFDSKWAIEQHLASSGLPHAILGPSFFLTNLLTPDSLGALKNGVYASPLPQNLRTPHTALEDIAGMAALALEDPDRIRNRRVDIVSDQLRGDEAAAILSGVLGRPVIYSEVPLENLPADLAKMFRWFAENKPEIDLAALRGEFPDVGWHSFEDWTRKQDWQSLLG
jgi:uncharacterized protein YbjT (DUF2867 family)